MTRETDKQYLDHRIPGELRDLARWCNWHYVDRGEKPPGKAPLDGASSTDPTTWITYEEARDRYLDDDNVDGLWFATGPVEPDDELAIAGCDLDHCVAETDEITDPRVFEILDRLGSYAEYSPGDGIRVFCYAPRGTRSIKREKDGFEFYAAKRWLSVTGNANLGTPLELAQIGQDTPREIFDYWQGATLESAEDGHTKDDTTAFDVEELETGDDRSPAEATSRRRVFGDSDGGIPVDRMLPVAKRCLELLDPQRADEYGSWISVLCVLKWIAEQTDREETLERWWHAFSKRCKDKYDEDDTQRRWDGYEAPPGDERLTIGSLTHWASEDSGKPIDEITGSKKRESKRKGKSRKRGWGIHIQSATEVTMEPVHWLWKHRIPRAKLTILAGDMGDGKSFVCSDLAARLSKGTAFPDGSPCPAGETFVINTEDDPSDTTVPRLYAAGAALDQISIYFGLKNHETGEKGRLDLQRDLPLIDEYLEKHPETQLVIIDPIGSFSGDRNLNAYHEVYGTLAPINEIAGQHGTAILGIVHMNKAETLSAKHRVTGSTGILAAARCGWVVLRDPDSDDKKRRLFLPLKQNNSAGDDTGLAFRITSDDPDGVAHLEWDEAEIESSADDILQRAAAVRGAKGQDPDDFDAVQFLKEILRDGPVDAARIAKEARAYGTSIRSCKRHKTKLGITSRRVGGLGAGGHWEWCLPEHLAESETDDDF